MKSLISVSIGPVQEFIAAARRTRDLWFGSHLLSELSKAAARRATEKGATLIFPSPQNPGDLGRRSSFQVVNKLLLTYSEAPADLVKVMREAVKTELTGQAKIGIEYAMQEGKIAKIDTTLIAEQLKTSVEFFAAWVPLDGHESYEATRTRVESLVGARKMLRDFPYYQGTNAKKSTIDGVRENVITDPGKYVSRMLKESERLDGIGLIKRFGGSQPSFESTSDVAAVPFARYALRVASGKPAVAEAIENYRQYVENRLNHLLGLRHNSPWDNRIGFGKASLALLTEHESKQDELTQEQQEELKRLQLALFKTLADKKPSPYYAMLMADGDGMGKALEELGRAGRERHQQFSQALSGFAARCREVVEQRGMGEEGWGNLIYAGGDDVLALLPVDTAVLTARKLHKTFSESMQDSLQDVKSKPTLSASIVIAHALDDLTTVRRVADKTLHEVAKDQCGRNALSITSMRRSGEAFTVAGKWGVFDIRLDRLLQNYIAKKVPFGLGHEWRRLAELCRRNNLKEDVVSRLARSILVQKSESAQSDLQDLTSGVSNAEELRRLADELVMAQQIFQCSYLDSPSPTAALEATA
jgi:CRISPR-associated protein Cmr2